MRQIKFMPLIVILCIILSCMITKSFAKSPLGIGVPEQPIDTSSIFSEIYIYLFSWQKYFETIIRGYLESIKENPHNAIWLIGLSFLYGILHAAGPGHGKAVISSYIVANDASLKRGIFLSFLSSILQALSAIFIILLVLFLLPGRKAQAENFLITGSYILVMILGIVMIWRKIKPYFHKKKAKETVFNATLFDDAPSATLNQQTSFQSSLSTKSTLNNKPRLNYEKGSVDHLFNGTGEICNDCGQAHMISPDIVKEPLQFRSALMAVLSVGLRPCASAIFVMSFATLNNLWLIGIVSVFAMSLGTFITVALLATLAVYAKSLALKISKRQSRFKFFKSALEWCAAIFIFLTGFSLTLTTIMNY